MYMMNPTACPIWLDIYYTEPTQHEVTTIDDPVVTRENLALKSAFRLTTICWS